MVQVQHWPLEWLVYMLPYALLSGAVPWAKWWLGTLVELKCSKCFTCCYYTLVKKNMICKIMASLSKGGLSAHAVLYYSTREFAGEDLPISLAWLGNAGLVQLVVKAWSTHIGNPPNSKNVAVVGASGFEEQIRRNNCLVWVTLNWPVYKDHSKC